MAALALAQMNEAYVQLSDDRDQASQKAGEDLEAAVGLARVAEVASLDATVEGLRQQAARAWAEAEARESEVRVSLLGQMYYGYGSMG